MERERTDNELVERSLGDPSAFAFIFRRHFEPIYGYLARRVGPELAEELTAEVFARAFSSRSDYRPLRASVLPWLFGIAANLIADHRRTELRRLRALERAPGQPREPGHADAAVERVAAERAAHRLAPTLAALDEGEREVLLLFAWAELSYPEIAEALSIPIGTVRSRLNRTRARLRDALKEDGHDPTAYVPLPGEAHA